VTGDGQDELRRFYDTHAEIVAVAAGTRAMHKGYFAGDDDPATLAEGSDRLTRLAGERLRLGPGHALLDIGCGMGQPALLLAAETGCSVTGVDASGGQIAAARRLAAGAPGGRRVSFHQAPATALPFASRSFDRALMLELATHLPDAPGTPGKQAAFAEAARCLRPGGVLALAEMVAAGPGAAASLLGEVPSVHLCSVERFAALLAGAGFEVLDVENLTPGMRHSGGRTRRAFQENRPRLTAAYGAEAAAAMAEFVERITEGEEHLGYVLITARTAA
jgi:cyclopropane fatty-acyl-phospholipid synthase-like methyltransferase